MRRNMQQSGLQGDDGDQPFVPNLYWYKDVPYEGDLWSNWESLV